MKNASLKGKRVCYYLKLMLLLTAFLVPVFSFAQSADSPGMTVPSEIPKPKYSFGVSGGFTGLFKGSPLTENVSGTDFVSGFSSGLMFESKLDGTNTFIQLSTETNRLNFKNDAGDNFENVRFTTIGVKIYPKFADRFYILPAVGIMTGNETQFITSFHLGYDFMKSDKSTYFIQIGGYSTDFQDNFISFRFGVRLHL